MGDTSDYGHKVCKKVCTQKNSPVNQLITGLIVTPVGFEPTTH